MKKRITFLLLFSCLNLSAQVYSNKQLKRIKGFLTSFQNAVDDRDTSALRAHIYSDYGDGTYAEIPRRIIEATFMNNEIHTADFSFSDRAFSQLVDSLDTRFIPIPDKLFQELKENREMFSFLKEYTPKELAIFDYKNVHIILVFRKRKIQLFFWEGMNRLLR